jgi:hypothetical protein
MNIALFTAFHIRFQWIDSDLPHKALGKARHEGLGYWYSGSDRSFKRTAGFPRGSKNSEVK